MAKQCKKCRHIRAITHNKKAKCILHGLPTLVEAFLKVTDRQKIKSLKFEMRMK